MKIIFIEEAANLGGARIATVDLVANLNRENGVSAKILDISGTCKPFLDYCEEKNVECNIIAKLNRPLIVSSPSLFQRIGNALRLAGRIIKVRKKLRAILKHESPDYIILNGYRRLLYLWGIKTEADICFYAHGWYIPQQISRFQKYLLSTVPTKFLCVSEATKHAVYANGFLPLDSIHVVHNGIDISALKKEIAYLPDTANCFKILHCGGFTSGKSQLVSVEIARALKQHKFKFKLIFTGIIYAHKESRQYYESVVNKVAEYGLENDVIFIVGKSNVIDYFRACDVLIHPSETEGLPLVVMEAMALHKPVIANSVGGVTDYILNGYTGFLPRHNCITDYADTIMRLAHDCNLYDYIVSNAYELVSEHFTVDVQLNSLLSILRKKDGEKESKRNNTIL